MSFEVETLPNGLEIVAECNPHALSAAVGFFVRTGARDEQAELAGVSHFLEHMAFKGSDRRTADDVNREFDEIGAKYNAYTTEEHTVYHAAVLPEYLPTTIDLLADLLRPSLRIDDFEMEKKVILEEIGMYADSPMWLAYERAMRVHFADHPLGNSVLGSEESVGALSADAMRAYHRARYSPSNLFVAAAGKIEWPRLLDLVRNKCAAWERVPTARTVQRTFSSGTNELMVRESFVQEWMFLLAAAPPADSKMRMAAEILANVIGDDSGSRFHWALVETGKVDSADFNYHEYEGVGSFIASISCRPEATEEDLATVRQILTTISRDGITPEELQQAKNKIGSRIVLAAERPQNRLSSLGYNWSYRKEYRSMVDDLKDLNAVTPKDVRELLDAYPLTKQTTLSLGPLGSLRNLNDY
ncbi:MAG: pitrilysin family protein [Planctomycetota bacterium]